MDKPVGNSFVGREGQSFLQVACGCACLSTFERGDVDSAHWYLSGHEHL